VLGLLIVGGCITQWNPKIPAALGQSSAAASPSAKSGRFDVRDYGAKGDGRSIDTDSINRAINAAVSVGGGTVVFSAGTYQSASIHLQSNITLDIGPGATLVAATPGIGAVYDNAEPNPAAGAYQDFGHTHWHNSLIWGDGLHDVAIVGTGRIVGTGLIRDDGDTSHANKAIALKLCRNVILRDITIAHGGWFGILATGVDNLTIDNLKIDTNRDGMDIDACRNVHISNCSVNSPQDDGICLKSSYGLGLARATENVTVDNCQVSGYDEGTFLDGTYQHTSHEPIGRIKLGTESNGGFKNIAISNCVFANCRGLALEEVDGGDLEDVSISNITMRDIGNSPIFLRLGGRQRAPAGTPMGSLRRVSISHIDVYNAAPRSSVIIAGVPGYPIQDVSMSDIHICYKGGGTASQASLSPPEDVRGYPEPDSFGGMPSYGFFVRHVKGLSLKDVGLSTLAPDLRPPFVLEDVDGARLIDVDAEHGVPVSTFKLTGVSRLELRDVRGIADGKQDRSKDGAM